MRIIGTGGAVPERRVTNDELAEFLDTSNEWISSRTGILERRVLTTETLEEIAAKAAKDALLMSGLAPSEIDYIICSNVYSENMFPGIGCLVQGILGLECPAIDISAACAGFVYALQVANGLIATGIKNILIISAEANSMICDWADRSVCVLMGDGAGAVVVTGGGDEVLFEMSSVPNSAALYAKTDSGNCPYTEKREAVFMQMNGQDVYKFAVSSSIRDMTKLMERGGITADDVGYFLLHQANMRIIDSARNRMKQPKEKFPTNIERFGNTSSASIPMLLDEMNRGGKLSGGEWILMSAFGAGLVTGACLLRWNKCN